jgi:hypothetical protein
MLLDPADTGLELADDHAVSNDRDVIVDHCAAQSDNLFAELLTVRQHVGATSARSACMSDLMSSTSEPTPETSARTDSKSSLVASSARIWRRSSRMRRAGSVIAGVLTISDCVSLS